MTKIDIAIVEDHRLVRQGFVKMLADYPHINILFESGNGKELLKSLKLFKPSIILLDMAMPILSGIKAMPVIKTRYPKTKIIVISSYAEEMSVLEYVKLGANGFLDKNCDVEHLVEVIHKVDDNGSYFDPDTSKLLSKHGLLPDSNSNRELTDREIFVLKSLAKNLPSLQIADLLGVNERTIRWYKHILQQKTGCNDTDQLILYAKRQHLI